MADFWIETDTATGGSSADLDDAAVLAELTRRAEAANAAGQRYTEAGMRSAIAAGPEKARSYLAMMRVVGNAAKTVRQVSHD